VIGLTAQWITTSGARWYANRVLVYRSVWADIPKRGGRRRKFALPSALWPTRRARIPRSIPYASRLPVPIRAIKALRARSPFVSRSFTRIAEPVESCHPWSAASATSQSRGTCGQGADVLYDGEVSKSRCWRGSRPRPKQRRLNSTRDGSAKQSSRRGQTADIRKTLSTRRTPSAGPVPTRL